MFVATQKPSPTPIGAPRLCGVLWRGGRDEKIGYGAPVSWPALVLARVCLDQTRSCLALIGAGRNS
uniref:Uncharacterized protein n=1 Tax=Candidatus Kentrum sp. UNK TaxID=2126344 RepID=A0A451AZF0_9GAMM|nr:MAG: hypothetical protein BECKUNK1418G_GA0071005_105914 [Candidatus Kentron sp. UNK]VFK71428.1 MAG: hypothetical protein BECKUNK1418H_GA0071006_106513 [Candidatus Kentron sp. UNK]